MFDDQTEQAQTNTEESYESYMAKRVKERDCFLAAISALKRVAQLPDVRSIPNHFAGTLGWLLMHEDDVLQELERNWEVKAQQLAAKQEEVK